MDLQLSHHHLPAGKPPKGKKKYVLFFSAAHKQSFLSAKTLDKAVSLSLPEHRFICTEDIAQGLKIFSVKNVDIVFFDVSCIENPVQLIQVAFKCKRIKRCSLFFVGHSSLRLMQEYKKQMFAFEENLDCFLRSLELRDICQRFEKIKKSEIKRAKNFLLHLPVKISRMKEEDSISDQPGWTDATLVDLSLFDFRLSLKGGAEDFRLHEQVRIQISLKTFGFFSPFYGEFLSLSGRVSTIQQNAEKCSFSIEHMTQNRFAILLAVLEKIYTRDNMQDTCFFQPQFLKTCMRTV